MANPGLELEGEDRDRVAQRRREREMSREGERGVLRGAKQAKAGLQGDGEGRG